MPVTTAALIAGGVKVLGGVAQAAFSGRKKKERDLEKFANSYTPNSSIMDYYNKSLARYNANPYQSQSYQNQQNLINRNLATGLSASQDRRGGLAALSGLVQGSNDASARAGAMAENQQAQALSQLGSAAGAKTREDSKKFDMIYNLKAMKAGQAAATQNAGLKNAFGGLGDIAMLESSNVGGNKSGENKSGENKSGENKSGENKSKKDMAG